MSQEEEQQQQPQVNNELTEQINKAHIAQKFTLLNGGTDNIIMITAQKEESVVNILITYEGLNEVVKGLKNDVELSSTPKKAGGSKSNEKQPSSTTKKKAKSK